MNDNLLNDEQQPEPEIVEILIENENSNLNKNFDLISINKKSIIKQLVKNNQEVSNSKKKVQFNKVDLYLFDRCQGHLSIPSSDNEINSITLGMDYSHFSYEKFDTQEDYFKYKRKYDLAKLDCYLAKTTSEISEEFKLLDPNLDRVKTILEKREYYENNIDEDLNVHADIMCPILSLQERLEKLNETGFALNEIDQDESTDINLIRESRKVCGCKCKEMNMICGENGDLCSCFANGINCQLDRLKFPCGCSLKRCKNQFGMKRFNPKTVLDHYKLKLSGKVKIEEDGTIADSNKINQIKRKGKGKNQIAKRKKLTHIEANKLESEVVKDDVTIIETIKSE